MSGSGFRGLVFALLLALLVHVVVLAGFQIRALRSPERTPVSRFTVTLQNRDAAPEVPSSVIATDAQSLSERAPVSRSEPEPPAVQPPVTEPEPVPPPEPSAASLPAPRSPSSPAPPFSAALLTRQIAEVSADLNRARQAAFDDLNIAYLDEIPRHRALIAAYEQAWQEKVQRIGNMNYPEEARRRKLTGTLKLAVAIRQDGTLYSVKVVKSSGETILDEAARNIVKLAAPFADFPEPLKREAEILVITRTWGFRGDQLTEAR